jgi:hypothetical protein
MPQIGSFVVDVVFLMVISLRLSSELDVGVRRGRLRHHLTRYGESQDTANGARNHQFLVRGNHSDLYVAGRRANHAIIRSVLLVVELDFQRAPRDAEACMPSTKSTRN